MMLLEESYVYKMGPPSKKEIKRTLSLFIDDLKTYQRNHQKLNMANEILALAIMDTGATYGAKHVLKLYLNMVE